MSFRIDRNSTLTYASQIRHQAERSWSPAASRLEIGCRRCGSSRDSYASHARRRSASSDTLRGNARGDASPERSLCRVTSGRSGRRDTMGACGLRVPRAGRHARGELGIDGPRLAQLVGALAQDPAGRAERRSRSASHSSPRVTRASACQGAWTRAFRSGWCTSRRLRRRSKSPGGVATPVRVYLRKEARKIAEAMGSQVVYVRYNVKLLDRSMAILPMSIATS